MFEDCREPYPCFAAAASPPSLPSTATAARTTPSSNPALFAERNEGLLQEIVLFDEDPPSEEAVHRARSNVFRALAANRISTRRAVTFGYLARLL